MCRIFLTNVRQRVTSSENQDTVLLSASVGHSVASPWRIPLSPIPDKGRGSVRNADRADGSADRTDGAAAKHHTMNKNEISLFSALLMLVSGIALSVAGFVVDPMGEISDSVLWYVAQALIYAGSIFGVGLYFRGKEVEMQSLVR